MLDEIRIMFSISLACYRLIPPLYPVVSLKGHSKEDYGRVRGDTKIKCVRKKCQRLLLTGVKPTLHEKLKLANSCWQTSKRWKIRVYVRQASKKLNVHLGQG